MACRARREAPRIPRAVDDRRSRGRARRGPRRVGRHRTWRPRTRSPRGGIGAMRCPNLPCRLVLPDGQLSCRDRPPEAHVRAYLRAVVAPQEEIARYMEFPRGRRVNGELEVARWPQENFHDPGDRRAIYEHVMSRLERGEEMFCGPVPRTEPKPRKDAVEAGRVLWVDIDRKSAAPPPTLADVEQLLSGGCEDVHDGLVAAAALVRFPLPPHVVVFSGSGGAHGYWRGEQILRAEWIERANARLIHALEADWASYDRNRFLRMPGGINGKNGRSCHLIHADLSSRAYDVRDLVGGLPDAPADDARAPKRIRRRQTAPSPRRSAIDDPIDRWTPREYFAALCNIREYDRDAKVSCPLPDHDDPRASLWIGEPSEQGCFFLDGDTRVMTWEGPRPIGDLAGSVQRVLTTGGFWRDAPFLSFGRQRLQRIVLSRNGIEKEILATPEHRWFVISRNGRDRGTRTTRQLVPGERLQSVSPHQTPAQRHMTPSSMGIARGFTFGDGSRLKKGSVAYMYGEKDRALLPYFPRPRAFRHRRSGALVVHGLPAYFKELPPLNESPAYLYGWLSGYFAADGHVSRDTVMLDSADRGNLEFARIVCDRLGIGTYGIARTERLGFASPGSRTAMYRLRFIAGDLSAEFFVVPAHRERFENYNPAYARRRWAIRRVLRSECTDEVFCAQVPGSHAFALEDNILTGNCFGCNRGGRIFDLVSLLVGGPSGGGPRGGALRRPRGERATP